LDQKGREWWGRVARANLSGEVRERGKIKPTTTSSWLRVSMGASITITTESTGGGAMAMTDNDISRLMPSLSRFFKSSDVRHILVHQAAMTATAQASASLCTSCSWQYLAVVDSESTDTPGKPAGRERTAP